MSVLIIGSEGSMGKRYQSILNHKFVSYSCYDPKTNDVTELKPLLESATHFIIAAPTASHLILCKTLAPYQKPILCEKPVTRSLWELELILNGMITNKCPFTMMLQYSKLTQAEDKGKSWYNYFKHGPDGLIWDCMQIIALAKDEIEVKEDSPVWDCGLNGRKLSLGDMDWSYIHAVEDFLDAKYIPSEEIFKIHRKVAEHEARQI